MRTFGSIALALALGASPVLAQAPTTRAFTVTSADGKPVNAQADLPAFSPSVVVILVGGTGLRDRDESIGKSGTARDLVFADLARRMNKRGVAAVRYDKRGIRHGALPMDRFDRAAAATATVETMRWNFAHQSECDARASARSGDGDARHRALS
ncbi:MAG TPA: hypothetical protein VEL74_22145 [Thermoanaerobaculia bacterium]|nr:hypothetical protein [Thermoanaerobaculia bacterium]